jgi:hypothetical protein
MNANDILAVQRLMSLYGYVIDERQWSRIADVFTDDVVYDLTDVGLGVARGIDAVRDLWTSPSTYHPLAHHVTDVSSTRVWTGPFGCDQRSQPSAARGAR